VGAQSEKIRRRKGDIVMAADAIRSKFAKRFLVNKVSWAELQIK
jgi:hypothetical protein